MFPRMQGQFPTDPDKHVLLRGRLCLDDKPQLQNWLGQALCKDNCGEMLFMDGKEVSTLAMLLQVLIVRYSSYAACMPACCKAKWFFEPCAIHPLYAPILGISHCVLSFYRPLGGTTWQSPYDRIRLIGTGDQDTELEQHRRHPGSLCRGLHRSVHLPRGLHDEVGRGPLNGR